MKLVLISDTHGTHKTVQVPEGDVLIHAGDLSKRGEEGEVKEFLEWFSKQPHTYKVFVAGNHDWLFERRSAEYIKSLIPENIIYLNDSGVEINGVYIWGSPIQPTFYNWAFNRDRGEDIKRHWDLIPEHTDVLITHGPPYGILDKTIRGEHVGCQDLMNTIHEIQPKLHVFGHIHEGYGIQQSKQTNFVNASILDQKYRCVNQPIVINI